MKNRKGIGIAAFFVVIAVMLAVIFAIKSDDNILSGQLSACCGNNTVGIEEICREIADKAYAEILEASETPEIQEEKLVVITQNAAGYELEAYVYVDMDHDGSEELIGAYRDDIGLYHTWYCSSDGEACIQVHQNCLYMDKCRIELLEFDDETHVVINAYRYVGTQKNCTILALKDNEVSCLISDIYGYVCMTQDGDIILDVEDYDAAYDGGSGVMMGHTWKDTYLYYDGETYKEYGAALIAEEEYLQYENAKLLKDMIAEQLTQPDTVKLEYSYFVRKNNILHIQCDVYNIYGSIKYGYYTVRISGNTLEKQLGEYTAGKMAPELSALEVTY